MVKVQELTPGKKKVIEVLSSEGYNFTEISQKIGCSRSAVSRNVKKLKLTGTMDNKKRSGRPRLSTARADNVLRRICLKNRMLTSKQLSLEWHLSTGTSASSSIVRRRLVSCGLRAHRAKQKPILSKVVKMKRLK